MDDHTVVIVTSIARIEAKLDAVVKSVNGNGMPGLVQKIDALEASKNRVWGMGAAMAFIIGLAEWFFHRK